MFVMEFSSSISDVFFTEKHLGQARDKKYWTKYEDSSLKKISENIPSKILYLVHQPGDLTHLKQSMILSRALFDKGILFKTQVNIYHHFPISLEECKSCLSGCNIYFYLSSVIAHQVLG